MKRLACAARLLAGATLVLGAGPGAAAEPALTYDSLLGMRFYDQPQAGYMADELVTVFESGSAPVTLDLVDRESKKVVSTTTFYDEDPKWKVAVFEGLKMKDNGRVWFAGPGEYLITAKVGGQPMTTLPVRVEAMQTGDEFNPGTRYFFEGPWKSLAMLIPPESDDADREAMHARVWVSGRDLPKGASRANVSAKMIRGKDVIARSMSDKVAVEGLYRPLELRLVDPPERPVSNFTLAKLVAENGKHALLLEIDGKPARRYAFEVVGGKVKPHPRSASNHDPHTAYLCPRWVDGTDGSTPFVREVYWLEAGAD